MAGVKALENCFGKSRGKATSTWLDEYKTARYLTALSLEQYKAIEALELSKPISSFNKHVVAGIS